MTNNIADYKYLFHKIAYINNLKTNMSKQIRFKPDYKSIVT